MTRTPGGDTGQRLQEHTGSTAVLDWQVGDDFLEEVSSKLKSEKRNMSCSVVSNYSFGEERGTVEEK